MTNPKIQAEILQALKASLSHLEGLSMTSDDYVRELKEAIRAKITELETLDIPSHIS